MTALAYVPVHVVRTVGYTPGTSKFPDVQNSELLQLSTSCCSANFRPLNHTVNPGINVSLHYLPSEFGVRSEPSASMLPLVARRGL